MVKVYLSRRNLQTLLNKLDRNALEGSKISACTLLKNDTKHPKFPNSHPAIFVAAVEDSEYYIDREPGEVLDAPES